MRTSCTPCYKSLSYLPCRLFRSHSLVDTVERKGIGLNPNRPYTRCNMHDGACCAVTLALLTSLKRWTGGLSYRSCCSIGILDTPTDRQHPEEALTLPRQHDLRDQTRKVTYFDLSPSALHLEATRNIGRLLIFTQSKTDSRIFRLERRQESSQVRSFRTMNQTRSRCSSEIDLLAYRIQSRPSSMSNTFG